MNTQITAFDLARRRARVVPLHKLSASIGAIAIAPVVLVALSTLALVLLARLMIILVAGGFEHRIEAGRLP